MKASKPRSITFGGSTVHLIPGKQVDETERIDLYWRDKQRQKAKAKAEFLSRHGTNMVRNVNEALKETESV